MKKLILFAAILAAFSCAYAQDGFYVLANIGSSANTDFNESNSDSSEISNDTDYTSYRYGLGYTKSVNENVSLGLEAAYNDYGSETYYYLDKDKATNTFTSYDILGTAKYGFNKEIYMVGKIGVAYLDTEVSEDYYDGDLSQKAWVPEAGAGLGYQITNHFAIEGNFSYINGSASGYDEVPDITVGWIGASFFI